MTALDKIIQAEQLLNEWLVDNTVEVFEEIPEVDEARDLLIEAIELMVERKPSAPLTDEEIAKALFPCRDTYVASASTIRSIVRAIESAHGITAIQQKGDS